MASSISYSGGFVANIAIGLVVLGSFTCLLLVTLIFLVLMSTDVTRRRPIFWFQTVAALMLILSWIALIRTATGILSAIAEGRSKMDVWRSDQWVAVEIASWVALMLLDATIILKAFAFFPPNRMIYRPIGSLSRFLPVAIPIIALIIRLPMFVLWLPCSKHTEVTPKCLQLQPIDTLLQIIGNGFATVIILYETHRMRKSSVKGHVTPSSDLALRLKLLVEATLLSFLPVVILQIAMAVFIFKWPNSLTIQVGSGTDDHIAFVYVYLKIANYVGSCVFSVIATTYQPIRLQTSKRDRQVFTPVTSEARPVDSQRLPDSERNSRQPQSTARSGYTSSGQRTVFDMLASEFEIVQSANKSIDLSDHDQEMLSEQYQVHELSRRSSKSTRPTLTHTPASSTSDVLQIKQLDEARRNSTA
ncbi:hypothetical protein CF319_g5100 [Tilletia indica]|nr:hypothetical protein CF319_g5100 [Tilletia indica]